jgi:hypothetical protein
VSAAVDARPIVFLGPTLPLATAETILDADYRPPIKRGDLPEGHPGPIIIIDGEFAQSLSVSPNEILRLVDAGTRVVGAASMGALRAAELYRYGMEGCGWIFDQYRSGRIDGDDEVAVTYSPDDLEPLTVPLVNVRRWLEHLLADGEIDGITARRLLARARRVFYADRTEGRLREELEAAVGSEELARLLHASGGAITDAKAEDARLVLAAAAVDAGARGEGVVNGDEGGGDGG